MQFALVQCGGNFIYLRFISKKVKTFLAILTGALLAAAITIIGFGIYNLLQTGWPEEKPELPWGPNAGIFYILLGVGLLLLALIRRFKK
jgi:TRAP-type C4-dicarboxylate transport system permease small subunit